MISSDLIGAVIDRAESLVVIAGGTAGVWGVLRYRGVRVMTILRAVAELPATSALVKATHEQTMTNHGSTLRDDVKAIRGGLEIHERRFQAYQDADGVATFYADGSGKLTWTSTGLEGLLSRGPESLLGFGAFDSVVDDERGSIRRRWASAFEDCRPFDCNCEIRQPTANGAVELTWVRVVATPVGPGLYSGYVRTIKSDTN